MQLSSKEKWNLYNNAKVDSASFERLSEKLDTAMLALKNCEERVASLESQLLVNQQVNKHLKEDMLQQRKCLNRLEQYGRRENLVVSGIPSDTENAEGKLIQLFNNVGVNISPADISACHPVKKKGDYILRFTNRKFSQQLLKKRSEVESFNASEI